MHIVLLLNVVKGQDQVNKVKTNLKHPLALFKYCLIAFYGRTWICVILQIEFKCQIVASFWSKHSNRKTQPPVSVLHGMQINTNLGLIASVCKRIYMYVC